MRVTRKYARYAVYFCIMAASGLAMSCADDWNDHYEGFSRPSRTLWQEITCRPELADFATLLKSRGYDRYLDSDQRYTVWAPMGEISTSLVTGESMTPDEVLTQVVENHIARGIIPASTIVNDTISVLNGKPMPFVAQFGKTAFNGAEVEFANIECSNGNLHILKKQAVYNNNVWSYLRQDAEFSDIMNYMYGFNKMVFDPDASTPGGVVGGKQVYLDSVFVQNNELWSQIGYLNSENRKYTMLVPVNDNWNRLVNSFKTFYNYVDEDGAEKADKYAQRKVLDALVFNMSSQPNRPLFWESTAGYEFPNPEGEGGLFAGTEPISCSNGTILKATDVQLDPYQILASEIVVEAENVADYLLEGRNYDTENDRPVFVAAAGTGVSSNYYMKFTTSSLLSGAAVTYALPDVLSCKYDIGVVFVPTNLTRNGWMSNVDQKKGRVDFELKDGYTGDKINLKDVEIPGDKVDTIWVQKGYEFVYCDYYPERLSMKDAKITLKITSKPKRSESNYTRDLYIDCIVLKPTINGDLSDEE